MDRPEELYKAKLVAFDPDAYATIDEEAFRTKYGEAADRFIQSIVSREHARLRALFEKKKRTIPFDEWTDDESKTNKYNDGIESCIAELQEEESPTT